MFFCSLIEELCTKEENDKTGCKLNFGHECITSKSIESGNLLPWGYLEVKILKSVLDTFIFNFNTLCDEQQVDSF